MKTFLRWWKFSSCENDVKCKETLEEITNFFTENLLAIEMRSVRTKLLYYKVFHKKSVGNRHEKNCNTYE